jgi:4-amino-4-deoxy-L-arabinose transferase-like glycosyltransferase
LVADGKRRTMMTGRPSRETLLTFGVAALAGVAVFLLAVELFPYGSANHDEGVYLQQAHLLLDGRFWFTTELADSFHWWFFVEDGSRLYPKYAPVPAAVFALGVAVGVPRLSLALVAFGIVALVGLLTAEAFDRRTGVLAAGIVAATPLFLFDTATFLPYATTTLFNLLFAYGYVRAGRTERLRWSVVAGAGVGLAFFARPYTAVLFALPFVVHASYGLLAPAVRGDHAVLRGRLLRNGLLGLLGLGGVGLALSYNALVTGDPLTFPYQAFAPRDGLGFGPREILGHSREYTPELALRANRLVLETFLFRWSFAAPFGFLLALLGLVVTVGPGATVLGPRASARDNDRVYNAYDEGLRVTYVGVALTVAAGNVLFWGNLNVLGGLADPTDGLVSILGPFYHLDLLLPVSAFAAAGVVFVWRSLRRAAYESDLTATGIRVSLAVVVVAALAVSGAATYRALEEPVERSAAYTDRYERVYEPFQSRADGDWRGGPLGDDPAFEDAVVFVPTPYGGWLGHPFQSTWNDAGLDGEVVYALSESPEETFAVIDAYPDRSYHRFSFRGSWTPTPTGGVQSAVHPLTVRDGERHEIGTTLGAIGRPSSVRLVAGTADGPDAAVAVYDVTADRSANLTVPWAIEPGSARVTGDGFDPRGDGVVDFDGTTELAMVTTFVQEGGATVSYRQELTVRSDGDRVELVWPPETRVCRLSPDCGYEGTYLPEGQGNYLDGVVVETSVRSA